MSTTVCRPNGSFIQNFPDVSSYHHPEISSTTTEKGDDIHVVAFLNQGGTVLVFGYEYRVYENRRDNPDGFDGGVCRDAGLYCGARQEGERMPVNRYGYMVFVILFFRLVLVLQLGFHDTTP